LTIINSTNSNKTNNNFIL